MGFNAFAVRVGEVEGVVAGEASHQDEISCFVHRGDLETAVKMLNGFAYGKPVFKRFFIARSWCQWTEGRIEGFAHGLLSTWIVYVKS